VVDYNNDGDLDLIMGERSGNLRLYSGNGDGTLHFEGNIWDDMGEEIRTLYNSSPYLADWDEDGYLDLILCGYNVESTTAGILRVYPNTQDYPDSLMFDADYLDYTSFYNKWRTTQQPFDLDRDGDKDLVLGYEMGDVFFAENIGTNENPQFTSYSVLDTDGGPMNVYTNYQGGGRARENVVDYNSDGVPDILVGCNSGWIYVFLGYDGTGIGEETSTDPAATISLVVAGSPTSGVFFLTVDAPEGSQVKVELYDAAGRVTLRRTLQAGIHPLDISEVPAGIYLVSARRDGEVATSRVVVVRMD